MCKGENILNIPKLQFSNRSREYDSCEEERRDQIIYAYLFEGKSHRKLDDEYANIDSNYSRGWLSMGILHYMGMRKEFKGIFSEVDIITAINELKDLNDGNYNLLIEALQRYYIKSFIEINAKDIQEEDEETHIVINKSNQKEGKEINYYVKRYERSPENRYKAIKIHGMSCMACGFNFEKVYGEIGKSYIEVHHVVPLSSIDEEIIVNPETDLITVCSNCHRMIHRRKNHVLSLEELNNLIINHNLSKK